MLNKNILAYPSCKYFRLKWFTNWKDVNTITFPVSLNSLALDKPHNVHGGLKYQSNNVTEFATLYKPDNKGLRHFPVSHSSVRELEKLSFSKCNTLNI